jgi:GNAT superfamily N-acetyltransferase
MKDTKQTPDPHITLRFATADDVGLILDFIRRLADYEKKLDEVVTDEDQLLKSLFGERRVAEVVIASYEGEPAGFALFFHNFSTFLGRPGVYLEDLFVIPRARHRTHPAFVPRETRGRAGLRAARVVGAGLERAGDPLLRTPRRTGYGRVDGVSRYGRRA